MQAFAQGVMRAVSVNIFLFSKINMAFIRLLLMINVIIEVNV